MIDSGEQGVTDPRPSISVIVPTIGRANALRALESLASQTCPPEQVVVVYNGPGQPSEWLTEQASRADANVQLVTLAPMAGPSHARNAGALVATGEWLAFLDDDDAFEEDYLEAALSAAAARDADIVYGAKVWPDRPPERRRKSISSVDPDGWLQALLAHQNPGFGGTNVVVKREVFESIGGFRWELPAGEDRAFALDALTQGWSIAAADSAVVHCFDPPGPRSNARADKWLANLRIHREFGQMASLSTTARSWTWIVKGMVADPAMRLNPRRSRRE